MRAFRNQMAFHWHENRKRLFIFGALLLFLDFWIIAGYGIYEPENTMPLVANNNFFAISIFIILITYITAANSFPLLLGSGYTRKQYFWGCLAYFGALGLAISFAQTLLMLALQELLPLLGFHLDGYITSFGPMWYSQFAAYFLLTMMFFLLSTLLYRYGLFCGVGLIAVYIFSLDAFRADNPTLIDATAMTLADVLPPHFAWAASLLTALICWLLYRSAEVKTF